MVLYSLYYICYEYRASVIHTKIEREYPATMPPNTVRSQRMVTISISTFFVVCVINHVVCPIFRQIFPYLYATNPFKHTPLIELESISTGPVIVNAQMLNRDMRRQLTASDGNAMIAKRLCSDESFIVARGGDAELLIVEDLLNQVVPRARQWPRRHSGIYPETPEGLRKFGDVYYDAMRSLRSPDLFAFFTHRHEVERVVLKQTLAKSVVMIHEDALSPFWFDSPWSSCLRDKVVLVIHPFIGSIKCQLHRRTQIFPNAPDVLPPFEAKFVKSFQCIGEEPLPHRDWNETLQATKQLIDEVGHFDVALIAAGSYGLPLAVYCKTKGASAVVIGGSLQQLFGLRGMRWENHYPTGYKYPVLAQTIANPTLYNSAWMFPLLADSVKHAEKIEHGSPYWGPPEKILAECPVH
jgi:hypothetical protein